MYTGTGIKKLREAAGLSRKELAYEVGASVASVKAWELGKRSPRGMAVKALERVAAEHAGKPEGVKNA